MPPLLGDAVRRVTPHGVPGLRGILRLGMGRIFGGPAFDPDSAPGDPGLYGPGSASWRVLGDAASIVGGIRGLVVQALHPVAVAGVADHSRFRDDPLGRLRRTSAYVTTVTFGSVDEALAVSRRVRAVHSQVRGTTRDGLPYRADGPHLLAWVSIALTSSFLASDRAYADRPIDPLVADAFVAEQARAAALLDPRVDLDAIGQDPGARAALRRGELDLPMLADGTLATTVAELDADLDRYRAELDVTDQGREVLRFLVWPPLPAGMRAAYLPLLAGAMATIDPDLRALAGAPTSRVLARAAILDTRTRIGLFRSVIGGSPTLAAATRRAEGGRPGLPVRR